MYPFIVSSDENTTMGGVSQAAYHVPKMVEQENSRLMGQIQSQQNGTELTLAAVTHVVSHWATIAILFTIGSAFMVIACNYYITILSFVEGILVQVVGFFSALRAAFLRRTQGLPRENDQAHYERRFRRWSSVRGQRSRQAANTGEMGNETPNHPDSVQPDFQEESGLPADGPEGSHLLGGCTAQPDGGATDTPAVKQSTSPSSIQAATFPRTKTCNPLAQIGE